MDLDATYRIVLVAKDDAWYNDRKAFIGSDGTISSVRQKDGNWVGCIFHFKKSIKWGTIRLKQTIFYKVLLKKLGQHIQLEDKTYMKPLNGFDEGVNHD